jgi:hypothetical protein
MQLGEDPQRGRLGRLERVKLALEDQICRAQARQEEPLGDDSTIAPLETPHVPQLVAAQVVRWDLHGAEDLRAQAVHECALNLDELFSRGK